MFGGLEIKGKGRSGSDAKKEETKAAPEPVSAASSGFSFLNAAPAPAPEPAPAASSAFSFLNATASATESALAPAAPPAALSGFSFLLEPVSAAPASSAKVAKTEEEPATTNIMDQPCPAAPSGFDFLLSSPPVDASKSEEVVAPAATTESSSNVSSAFSFLAPPADNPEPSIPTDTTPSSLSMTTTTPAKSIPLASTTTTTTSFSPAGTGVSFGGATVNANRPKKKKNRAMKVGMGASSSAPSLPPPMSIPEPTKPVVESSKPPSVQERSIAEEALEATRRAEQFLDQKMKEHTVSELGAADERAKAAKKTSSSAPPANSSSSGTAKTQYEDDIMAAAAAAAKEAQALSQKGVGGGSRGIMGGLFRRSSPPTSSNNLSGGSLSRQGSKSNTSGQGRPPKPTSMETAATKPSSGNSLSSDDGKSTNSSDQGATKNSSSYNRAASSTASASRSASPSTLSSPPPLPPKHAPKPEPPQPKAPRDLFKGMLQAFRQNVERSMAEVTQLRRQRSRLLEERNRALAQERLATQQRELAEQQQTAAAEAEDFELADQLGAVLTTCEKDKENCARTLKQVGMAIQELDNQNQTVVEGVLMCFRTIQTQLQTFESTQESKEHKSDDSAMKKFAAMTKHLASEHERLQQDLKHLERDEGLAQEERQEVENAISELSCEFEKQRELAKEKLSTVDEEIEELRKQLKAKEVIATQLRNDIAGHDDSILQVRVQFSRQLQRVQKKETTIKDHRHEWEIEKARFQAEKESHEAEVQAHSEELEAHEKLMASLKEEISLAGVLEKIVENELGDAEKPSEDNGEDTEVDSDLLSLQADLVKYEAKVTEAMEVLRAATNTMNNLEEEMKSLIARIPELEAIKKAGAAKRDFKAAGKASKEIKDATMRVKECQEELTGEAVARKETAESELKKLEGELEEKRKIALEKEKESGVAFMKKLAKRIQHLVETKKQVCGGEYEPDRVQGVGVFVLEEQITSLALEGKAYGMKYGGWEELVADILPTETTTKPENGESEPPSDQTSDGKDDAPAVIKEKETPKPQFSKKEMKAKFRQLSQELQKIEASIESAVESEDYDLAAELDETLQKLMSDVQALDLTDEEMEDALGESGVDDNGKVTGQGTHEEIPAPAVAGAIEDAAADDDGEVVNSPSANSEDEATAEGKGEEDHPSPPAVTPNNGSGDDNSEPAKPLEDVDEKKDGAVDDGFVAVGDNDL